MTREEAGKKLLAWVRYMEDPSAVPDIDQPCTDDEIIEAMSVAGRALSEPSLLSSLDVAAERWAEKHPFNGRVSSFKEGAEWLAKQGVTKEITIGTTTDKMVITVTHQTMDMLGVEIGDTVIVQIRKK